MATYENNDYASKGVGTAGLQNIVNRISAPFVPNYAVAPGWGPAFVSPFPPVPPVVAGSGTTTPTPAASTSTAQAS